MTNRGPETFTTVAPALRVSSPPCVSTSSPGPRSRSGSTSCGRSPSGSSGSGIAGFGWGAAWLDSRRPARLVPRRPGLRATTPAASGSGRSRRPRALVHLRRPSRLSTLTLADTQPFDDPAGRFAFSHNGDLRDYKTLRATYRAQGRIHGRADTEVGARWLEDAWQPDEPVGHLLGAAARPVRRARRTWRVLAADGTPSPLRRQRREPGLLVPARPDRRRLDRASTRSTGRSSGSSRPARPSAGSSRCGTTVALDPNAERRPEPRRMGVRPRGRASWSTHGDRDATARGDRMQRPAIRTRRPTADGRPTARLPNRRADPDLALLARAVVDLRRPEHDHDRPARVHRPGRPRATRAGRSSWSRSAARSSRSIVQPTVGSISDYTITRWGRRKPYIFIGSILDVVFLVGIAIEQHARRASRRSSRSSSSARTSPRDRSRATSRISSRPPRSARRARSSG